LTREPIANPPPLPDKAILPCLAEIADLVFALYGLSDEEIALVRA